MDPLQERFLDIVEIKSHLEALNMPVWRGARASACARELSHAFVIHVGAAFVGGLTGALRTPGPPR